LASRISPPATPGLLLKGSAPVKKRRLKLGRNPRERDEEHLSAIRVLQCISCGLDQGCEAAHIRMSRGKGTGGGTGLKPSDEFTLPLCSGCHRQQHAEGEESFYEAIDLDPHLAAAKLYAVSPSIDTMRAIVALFLASRIIGEPS